MSYLLLHGFTGSPSSFSHLHVPEGSLVPALAGHLGAPGSPGFWEEVERLAALGQGCRGLFGYSLGGRLALGLLARYPERFEHAIVVSAHPGLASEAERTARRESDLGFVRLLREQGLAAFVRAWEALPLWASQDSLPEAVRSAQRKARLAHDPLGLADSLVQQGLAEMPDLRPLLARVRCLVSLLVGERDPKFTALGRELCGIIPRARLTVATGAGHNLLLERADLCSAGFLEGNAT